MEPVPDIAVVSLSSDLDVTAVPRLRAALDAAIGGGCRRVVLNMARVGFVDSAGMGLIMSELRRLRGLGGLLSLTNVSAPVFHALEVMRMVDVMPVSMAGAARAVGDLDPVVVPLWRTTFRVEADRMAEARDRVAQLLDGLPFSSDDAFDMRMAVGEAIGNAIDHTCSAGVIATVAAYPDRAIVDVADCGEGFSLGTGDEPPEVGEFAERGRGIRLMRMLADAVSIGPKPSGRGTVVRIVKLVNPAVRRG